MNLRSRNFLVVVSLVLLLCVGGVGMAIASPDGDDDQGYNAAGETGFGTQYSLIDERFEPTLGTHPVTTQDTTANGANSSVTAVLIDPGEGSPRIQLVRYDADGVPVSDFGDEDGVSVQFFPGAFNGEEAVDLLDIRVLEDGTIRVLARAQAFGDDSPGARLWVFDFDSDGQSLDADAESYAAPDSDLCESLSSADMDNGFSADTYLNAARIGVDGETSALWTCDRRYTPPEEEENPEEENPEEENPLPDDPEISFRGSSAAQTRGIAAGREARVALYASGADSESDSEAVPTVGADPYGQDLELGPGGDPYVLTGSDASDEAPEQVRLAVAPAHSQVFHYAVEDVTPTATRGGRSESLVIQPPTGGSKPDALPGLPVDLAVDSSGRPLVWTENDEEDDAGQDWLVYRLTAALATDTSWGSNGKSTISDPRLDGAFSTQNPDGDGPGDFLQSLTVRPDNRVLVTGSGNNEIESGDARDRGITDTTGSTETSGQPSISEPTRTAIVAGLTDTGATDTGFGDAATPGFRAIDYVVPAQADGSNRTTEADFEGFGEPKNQTDGKLLVPHTSSIEISSNEVFFRRNKIAPPPSDGQPGLQYFVGVTRLKLDKPAGPATTPSNPGTGTPGSPATRPSATRPVTPSSARNRCGRRVISLVRADVRGAKIRLSGLVGSKLYGKRVTIETNPTAVKASAYSRTTTVTASKTGTFAATVAAPKRSQFKTVRYRAKSGGATSPVLKLPQSLTSRSVRSAKGTITVKGKVKRSVLGKRNSVKIRRLVCGRYRTVAVVKPAADGSYTATFKATKIRGVSFYRAESKVQVRPGSKKYAIQYARAIAIRTTSQTG